MAKIDFSYGATVYWDDEEYKVVGADGLTKVNIKHTKYGNVASVSITELSTKPFNDSPVIDLNDHSEHEWDTAKKRLEIIKPLIGTKRSATDIQKISSIHKVGQSTVYRWLSAFESNPTLSALIPQTKKRGPKEKRLPKDTNEIINDILEGYYLKKQKHSFKRTYMKIKQACIHENTPVPSENTVRNRIKEIDPMYMLKRRENYKTALSQYGDFSGEFKNGNYPLDVYQIDHTPLDIILVDDLRRLPIGRPYLTLAIDVYSRMVAGFFLSFQGPGFFNVGQCLYQCFLPKERYLKKLHIDGEWPIYGTPRVIHVDNGAELVGTEVQRVCEEYGISIEKRPVARPQFGGHVERIFGTINKEIHNLHGATFSNVKERGSYDSEKQASLTIKELEKWLTQYIVNIYHKTYHNGIETTPLQRYQFGIEEDENNPQVGILPAMIEDDEHIRISLLPTFYRTVQRNGITLEDITYYDDTLRRFVNRKDINDQKLKLKIKRDPMDISRIHVYDPNLNIYLDVPYRRMSAPAMNIWELQAIKRFLADQRKTNYDENDIFRAYHNLEVIEKNAKRATNSLRKQTPPSSVKKPSAISEDTPTKDSNEKPVRKRSFGKIEIFDVVEYKAEGKDS